MDDEQSDIPQLKNYTNRSSKTTARLSREDLSLGMISIIKMKGHLPLQVIRLPNYPYIYLRRLPIWTDLTS